MTDIIAKGLHYKTKDGKIFVPDLASDFDTTIATTKGVVGKIYKETERVDFKDHGYKTTLSKGELVQLSLLSSHLFMHIYTQSDKEPVRKSNGKFGKLVARKVDNKYQYGVIVLVLSDDKHGEGMIPVLWDGARIQKDAVEWCNKEDLLAVTLKKKHSTAPKMAFANPFKVSSLHIEEAIIEYNNHIDRVKKLAFEEARLLQELRRCPKSRKLPVLSDDIELEDLAAIKSMYTKLKHSTGRLQSILDWQNQVQYHS